MAIPTLAQSPTDPAFVQDPYPFYARAHEAGGVFHWAEYDRPMLANFADVSAVLRDRRLGREPVEAPEIPDRLRPFYDIEAHSMLEREPPAHTRLRALVNRAFTSRAVDAMAGDIAALAHRLIDDMSGEVDLLPAFCEPIPVITIANLLGAPEERAQDLLAWSHAMVAMYEFGRSPAAEDAACASATAFSAFIEAHIEARRARPGEALIDRLIAAEEAGDRLSTPELITTCILLLNAGHEATVHALGNGVKALLEHGATPAAAPDAEALAEEILRYDPPLHMFMRTAYEDVEIGPLRLKRGEEVGLLLAATARDPARFAAPGRFDPARTDGAHVSFGAGIHFCVGAPLARLEMRIALPILFERLPDLSLSAPPRFADRYHFHGLERLDVVCG